MSSKVCPGALGLSGAIVTIIYVVVFSILAHFGYFKEHLEFMQKMHPYFTLSLMGVGIGALVAGFKSFVSLLLLGLFYNYFISVCKCKTCTGDK